MAAKNHAVWVYPIAMGACNGCDQQILALNAPAYQLRSMGISFVNSPRHADIVLLTGVLTKRMRSIVERTLEAVPSPHALVAVGDCAIHGGVFADNPQIFANASDILNVNIEIAGDPPTPDQIIAAIVEAARQLDEADKPANTAESTQDEEDSTK